MTGSGGNGSLKALQESAMEIYRSIVPVLRRCSSFRSADTGWMASMGEKRASRQQAENLKWQQDMFLRLVNLAGLCQEGLISEADVASFRLKILDNIVVCYDGGESPDVTRDKLLFLQELLYARCISEEEYHLAKKPILYRLADQGAEINSSDIILSSSAAPLSAPSTPLGRNKKSGTSEACTKEPGIDRNKKMAKDEPSSVHKAKNERTPSKSPVKHLIDAMSRLKHGSNGKVHHEEARPRVPHALDFLRPKDCPIRDPPTAPEFDISEQCGSPLFYSPSGSVSSMESSSKGPMREPGSYARHKDEPSPKRPLFPSPAARTLFPTSAPPQKSPLSGNKSPLSGQKPDRSPLEVRSANSGNKVGNLLTNIMRKLHGEETHDAARKCDYADCVENSEQEEVSTTPKKPCRLDLLRPPRIITNRQEIAGAEGKAETADSSNPPNRAPKMISDTTKLKKKLHSRGASTDFFIDKVLGENIKNELERIRSEINKTNSTQTFTNDQIDAIATRLPADKAELMRFFPKSWCDRYGDIVLDVVHKEFKGHIKDMETARKNAREKRKAHTENDENSGGTNFSDGTTISKASSKNVSKASVTRCFTTMDENSMESRNSNQVSSKGCRTPRRLTSFNPTVDYEKELDGKLRTEIQKMPHRRTPDAAAAAAAPLRV